MTAGPPKLHVQAFGANAQRYFCFRAFFIGLLALGRKIDEGVIK
jgi:hypothetical protein